MKVKELIAELQKLDPETLVVLAKDAEGNGYKSLADVNAGMGFAAGEIGYLELTNRLREAGYTEDDLCAKDAVPCVVLWP
jgi:hypothetical protein